MASVTCSSRAHVLAFPIIIDHAQDQTIVSGAVTKLILFHSWGSAAERGSKCFDAFGKDRPEHWFTPPATSARSPDSANDSDPLLFSFTLHCESTEPFQKLIDPCEIPSGGLSLSDKCRFYPQAEPRSSESTSAPFGSDKYFCQQS